MWHYFPGQYMPSYQVNRALTQAHYGGGEFAEILEVASEIDPLDRESFNRAWVKMGDKVYEKAEAYAQANQRVSARRTYLRAFNYLRTAEFFMTLHDERKIPYYLKCRDAFIKAIDLFDERPITVDIPFEGSTLPAYLFLPNNSPHRGTGGRPPVMVMFGGLDSLAEELYFGKAQHLTERGIDMMAVDGPGQGVCPPH